MNQEAIRESNSTTELTNEQMFYQLTDGDYSFNEYLSCLPTRVDSLINPTKAYYRQCIKCCLTRRYWTH